MITNILEYLETTADWMPENTAVSGEEDSLTFRQLRDLGRAIGSALLERGCTGRHVPIFMERSPAVFAAITGCLYAGAIYTVLDPELAPGRVEKILARLSPSLVLCDPAGKAYLEKLGRQEAILPFASASCHPICPSALGQVRERITDRDPVYTVFTSGSTGEPKAVVGCHRGVIDYIEGLCQVLSLDCDSVFGSQSPLYYDAWLKEWVPVLKYGGRMELLPKGLFRTPVRLMEYLNQRKVNTLCWVASAFSLLSALGTLEVIKPEQVRLIAFASEVFPRKELKKWRSALPSARFFNLYGPTEATGVCCAWEVTGDRETLPIGRPFPNTRILLLEEDHQVPAGDQGEICVLGSRLALGYLGADQGGFGTALVEGIPRRVYRTGDLGRWNEQGELEFLGRADRQIKHMGHRIELGEIEAAAMTLPQLRECACTYDNRRIRLFYAGDAEEEQVAGHLKAALPAHMCPRTITRLEKLPRLPNGKADRNSLT